MALGGITMILAPQKELDSSATREEESTLHVWEAASDGYQAWRARASMPRASQLCGVWPE